MVRKGTEVSGKQCPRAASPTQYELAPYKDLMFQVKGLDGFGVEFTKNAAGQITEAIFRQPNGTFPAKRK